MVRGRVVGVKAALVVNDSTAESHRGVQALDSGVPLFGRPRVHDWRMAKRSFDD